MKKEDMSSKKRTNGSSKNKYKILSKYEQCTHLIQTASERAIRYDQKRFAAVQKC